MYGDALAPLLACLVRDHRSLACAYSPRARARAAGMSDAEALAAVGAVRATLGTAADVHLFSSIEGRYGASAFAMFRARGAVHL